MSRHDEPNNEQRAQNRTSINQKEKWCHLSGVRLLAAPLAEVGHAALLQLRVQLHIQRPLVENPLNLHLTVPR